MLKKRLVIHALKIKLFFIYVLVFNLNIGFSQDNIVNELLLKLEISDEDTNKVILLNDLCWELAFVDDIKSIEFGQQSIELAEKLNYTVGLQDAFRYTGRTYSLYGQNEEALRYLKKALEFNTNNLRSIGLIHNDIGCVYDNMADYAQALEHFYSAIRIFDQIEYSAGIGLIKINMVNIYIFQSDYSRALKLSEEAYELYESIEEPIYAGIAMFNKGTALISLKRYKQANESLRHALNIFDQENDIRHKSEVLNSFGNLHQELGNLDSALYYFNESLLVDISLGNQLWEAKSYSNIAGVYFAKEAYEKAVEYNELALKTAKDAGDLQWFMTTIRYLSEDYYQNGQHQLAYEYRLFYDQIKDSIFSETRSNQVLELTEKYETEKKDQEIITLKKLQEASTRENKLYYTALGISILTLLLIVFSILLYLRNQNSKNKILQNELEQKAFRAQMNPHFIFNSLNSIQRMYIEGKEDTANDYMADFSRLLRGILENSGKSKIMLNEEIEITKLYLDLERMRSNNLFDYKINIDDEINALITMVPPLILQPYIENAIWHGIIPKNEKGRIDITIALKKNRQLTCEIKDTGVGFNPNENDDQKKQDSSHGMEITARRLGGYKNVHITSSSETGTKVVLTVQI